MPLSPEDAAPPAPPQRQPGRGEAGAGPGSRLGSSRPPRRALLGGDGGAPTLAAGRGRRRAEGQAGAVRSEQREGVTPGTVLCSRQAQDAASFRDVRAGLGRPPGTQRGHNPGQPGRAPALPPERGLSARATCSEASASGSVLQRGQALLPRFQATDSKKQRKKPQATLSEEKAPPARGPRSKPPGLLGPVAQR